MPRPGVHAVRCSLAPAKGRRAVATLGQFKVDAQHVDGRVEVAVHVALWDILTSLALFVCAPSDAPEVASFRPL